MIVNPWGKWHRVGPIAEGGETRMEVIIVPTAKKEQCLFFGKNQKMGRKSADFCRFFSTQREGDPRDPQFNLKGFPRSEALARIQLLR
jgi:hypothetical protein